MSPADIILGTLSAYAVLLAAVLAVLHYAARQDARAEQRTALLTRLRAIVEREQDCRRYWEGSR